MGVEYHVTVVADAEDPAFSVAAVGDALLALQPASVLVDAAGIGRVVLASLQARGLPAKALEKRPRPTLPEIQRCEELSQQITKLKHELELAEKDLHHLRTYQRDIRVLIERLDT